MTNTPTMILIIYDSNTPTRIDNNRHNINASNKSELTIWMILRVRMI